MRIIIKFGNLAKEVIALYRYHLAPFLAPIIYFLVDEYKNYETLAEYIEIDEFQTIWKYIFEESDNLSKQILFFYDNQYLFFFIYKYSWNEYINTHLKSDILTCMCAYADTSW